MEIEWDPAKDAENIATHGLALEDPHRFELSEAVVSKDGRSDYGEARFRAFGRIDGLGHCRVFTLRDETIRVISFRRAHDKELRRYGL